MIKRLLLLLFLLLVSGFLYLVQTGELRYVLDEIRSVRETDVPAEFKGKYVVDVAATRRYIRNSRIINPKAKNKLSEWMEAETMQIRRASMIGTSESGSETIRFRVRVIEKGPNWMVFQNASEYYEGRPIVVRVDKDATGLWFSPLALKGLKFRYTKL
jgi:hypothetical protein